MKINNYRKLNNEERRALRKTLNRNNIKLNLNNLEVAYSSDSHKLFTDCIVRDLSDRSLYIGSAKRMKCDRYNPTFGKIIALRRALVGWK